MPVHPKVARNGRPVHWVFLRELDALWIFFHLSRKRDGTLCFTERCRDMILQSVRNLRLHGSLTADSLILAHGHAVIAKRRFHNLALNYLLFLYLFLAVRGHWAIECDSHIFVFWLQVCRLVFSLLVNDLLAFIRIELFVPDDRVVLDGFCLHRLALPVSSHTDKGLL